MILDRRKHPTGHRRGRSLLAAKGQIVVRENQGSGRTGAVVIMGIVIMASSNHIGKGKGLVPLVVAAAAVIVAFVEICHATSSVVGRPAHYRRGKK